MEGLLCPDTCGLCGGRGGRLLGMARGAWRGLRVMLAAPAVSRVVPL